MCDAQASMVRVVTRMYVMHAKHASMRRKPKINKRARKIKFMYVVKAIYVYVDS